MTDPTNGMQARTDGIAAELRRLIPAALDELEATNHASRGALAGAWLHDALSALDLSAYVLQNVHVTSVDLLAHARMYALQAQRLYGVKVFGLVFCAAHHPGGLPTMAVKYLCPACVEEVDDADADVDAYTDLVLLRKIESVTPRGDLL
jgi:hypothetical protein